MYKPNHRRDMFAAAALQGLLASGQFTDPEDKGEPVLYDYEAEGPDGKTVMKRGIRVVEVAWHIAKAMDA